MRKHKFENPLLQRVAKILKRIAKERPGMRYKFVDEGEVDNLYELVVEADQQYPTQENSHE